MNRNTKIEWTDMTWNPIIGCHKISPGCDNCYAEKMAKRISHMDTWIGEQYRNVIGADGKWNWETHVADSHMDFPKIKKPKRVFVGSMTDIFLHSQSKEGRLDVIRLFSVMAAHPQHTFQVLTKRPVEMKLFIDSYSDYTPPNVWLGVTVCNQEEANFKIPILLDTQAAKRFISVEPMLGPINLSPALQKGIPDWVIVGGETGPKARPTYPEHIEKLWYECKKTLGIPFFFKSYGSYWSKSGHKSVLPLWDQSSTEYAKRIGLDKGMHDCKEFPI